MKHALIWPALFGLLTLAACATPAPINTNCPNVAVLEQANTVTLFLPGRSDVAAQVAQAQFTGVAGSCQLENKTNVLRVTFQAGISVASGPAYGGGTLIVPYLVSQSVGDTILGTTYDDVALKLDGNASTAVAVSKPITLKFKNDRQAAMTQVLIGFHLTPDQLAYNAAHPGQ